MDITKYEHELQQMCSRELSNILQTYYNKEAVRVVERHNAKGDKVTAVAAMVSPNLKIDDCKDLGEAFTKLGELLDYGAMLIETLQEMNIDLTAEQYRAMLIAKANLIDDLIDEGMEMVGTASSDRCRDDIESYLMDNGLMGR